VSSSTPFLDGRHRVTYPNLDKSVVGLIHCCEIRFLPWVRSAGITHRDHPSDLGAVDKLNRTVPTSASRLTMTTPPCRLCNFCGARQARARVPVELLTADQSTFWGKFPIWAAGLQPTPQGHKSQLVEAAGLDLRDQHLVDRTLISLIA
jgi:hypothetical protein